MKAWMFVLVFLTACAAGRRTSDNRPTDQREFSVITDLATPEDLPFNPNLPDLMGADLGVSAGDMAGQCATVDVVINEIQTDGASGTDEFIELYNPCAGVVDLTNYKLVYRSSTGSTDITILNLAQPITPLGYLLFANAGYTGTRDADFTQGLSKSGGGVALLSPGGAVLDSVGWGNATNAFIEGTVAAAPGTDQSIARTPNGNDTDNNATDFTVDASPTPRAAN